ncbi:uncharacterized protein N7459_005203 [Penicillium hispanicum]|uniref:uncharacterized protein n=1 Tax=Penicillium hispanicum TaxID=1080232 RepID=UPI00253FD848|nr:uncharacterized protein N7459_005203 [Penicillium hispanicum]KAJ5585403.1 hypothetical protein N7459_005203 [Penicillium hispanicum]
MAFDLIIKLHCFLSLLALCLAIPHPPLEPSRPHGLSIGRRDLTYDENFFNFQDTSQEKRIMSALNLIPQLINWFLDQDISLIDTIMSKYFLPEHVPVALQVFRNAANPSLWTDDLHVYGEDWQNMCATGHDGRPTAAYTILSQGDQCSTKSSMHFCTSPLNAYGFPSIRPLTCSSLAPELKVSPSMATFEGFLVFHELMHVRDITEGPLTQYNPPYGVTIDVTYGPVKCRALRQDSTNAHKAIFNADSYAIAATELYTTRLCRSNLQSQGLTYLKDPTENNWMGPSA